jgi:uncharacterized Zn finger protein (UPF0148 family)
VTAERRRRAATERLPDMLPAICPDCRVVLGLVVAGGEMYCPDCGVWASTEETLARIPEVLS